MASYFHYRIFRDVFTNILPYNFLDGPMFCTCMKWAWKMIQWYFGHLMMDRCFARTWSERENQLNHVITTVDTVIFRSFNDRIIKVLMKYKGWLSDVFSLWRQNQCLSRGYLHEQTKYTCTTVSPKMIGTHFTRVHQKSGHV